MRGGENEYYENRTIINKTNQTEQKLEQIIRKEMIDKMIQHSKSQSKNSHNRKEGSCQEEHVDYHLSSKTIF